MMVCSPREADYRALRPGSPVHASSLTADGEELCWRAIHRAVEGFRPVSAMARGYDKNRKQV